MTRILFGFAWCKFEIARLVFLKLEQVGDREPRGEEEHRGSYLYVESGLFVFMLSEQTSHN